MITPVIEKCWKCGGNNIERVKLMYSPSRIFISDWCWDCSRNARGSALWVKKEYAGDLETLKTIDRMGKMEPCCVDGCENVADEWHHFAPVHIFKKLCNDYPMLPLCKMHHDLWHLGMAYHDVTRCPSCSRLRKKARELYG